MANTKSTFGSKIKEFRMRHTMTQSEFAAHVGVSVPTIRRFETGKKYEGSDLLRAKINRGMRSKPAKIAA